MFSLIDFYYIHFSNQQMKIMHRPELQWASGIG